MLPRLARAGGLGLCCTVGAVTTYAACNPEQFILTSSPRVANTDGKDSFAISKRDPLLSAARRSVEAALRTKDDTEPLLLFISGSSQCGSHRLAREFAVEEDEATHRSLCIDATKSLTERVQGWILTSLWSDWRFAWCGFLIENIIRSEGWKSRFLPSNEAALKLLSSAMEAEPLPYRIIVTGEMKEDEDGGKDVIEWVFQFLVANPATTAIVSSSTAPFGLQRLVEALHEQTNPIPFAHVRIREMDSLLGQLDPENLVEFDAVRSLKHERVEAVFQGMYEQQRGSDAMNTEGQQASVAEDMDELVHGIETAGVGFRLENLVRLAETFWKPLSGTTGASEETTDVNVVLKNAIDEVIDEEIEVICERLQVENDSMDALQADLTVWIWEVLELLSGSVTRPDFGRPEDKSVPPLPSTIPSTKFTARDIPELSFGLLECKSPLGENLPDDLLALNEIPPAAAAVEAMEARQYLVAADSLTLQAFRKAMELSEEKSAVAGRMAETIALRKADLHRREDEATYAIDLEDYLERRASFNRSVAFFRNHVRDYPDTMDKVTIISKELEISHLQQRFDIEQRELETRFAHLWPIVSKPLKASKVSNAHTHNSSL